jgi:hypothetical protein
MAIRVGDRVRSRRELPGRILPPERRIAMGTEGTVFRVSLWSGSYSVRFDNDAKRERLTDADIEPRSGWR